MEEFVLNEGSRGSNTVHYLFSRPEKSNVKLSSRQGIVEHANTVVTFLFQNCPVFVHDSDDFESPRIQRRVAETLPNLGATARSRVVLSSERAGLVMLARTRD